MFGLLFATTKENGWQAFWRQVGEWFWTKDDAGLNYLMRIGISIAVIVIAWLLLRVISLIYKKAFHVKKPIDIDVSAKFFILNSRHIFLIHSLK